MRLFETFDLRASQQLIQAVASPFDRLADMPAWAKLLAGGVAVLQYIQTDAFGGTITLVVVIGVIDYLCGVKAARFAGVYDPRMAHAGAMGKIIGVILVVLLRSIEALIYTQGLLNTRGAIAVAIGISLVGIDLQSIAHHRETFGAKPIPLLSRFLEFLRRILDEKFPIGGAK